MSMTHWYLQKSVADAMRELLETFRLPGESQQIDRIAEVFAKIYFASDPGKPVVPLIRVSAYRLHSRSQVSGCSLRSGFLYHHAEHRSA